ncbi:MAG: hypothetical protein JSS60_00375 [Verrucomicrobia bacterium]|nr:hypothetical protein [Verrucomicrobiota bacterium]
MSTPPTIGNRDFTQYVCQIGKQVIARELDDDHFPVNVNQANASAAGLDREDLPEVLALRILEIISTTVEKDPIVQASPQREYNIEDLHKANLILTLQKKLGLHPYSH